MKLYTKTGDAGETSLYGGARRSKADQRIVTYGGVDELQAALGVAMAALDPGHALQVPLEAIQHDTFVICCELARIDEVKPTDPVLNDARITWLEGEIDRVDASLPPLRSFIMQGGSLPGAQLHLARTICRRAEREVVALAQKEEVSPLVLRYLNRLSDYIFVAARGVNHEAGIPEKAIKLT